MNFQLKAVIKESSKALQIIAETKKKLEKCRDMALCYIDLNTVAIFARESQVSDLHQLNNELNLQISKLDNAISETDKILGK